MYMPVYGTFLNCSFSSSTAVSVLPDTWNRAPMASKHFGTLLHQLQTSNPIHVLFPMCMALFIANTYMHTLAFPFNLIPSKFHVAIWTSSASAVDCTPPTPNTC
jgi:hypothetical protein